MWSIVHGFVRLGIGILPLAVASACTEPDCTQIEALSAEVTVLDAATNQPIGTAAGTFSAGTVQLSFTQRTSGRYTVGSAKPDTYVAQLTAPGYAPWDSTIVLRANQACGGGVQTARFTVGLSPMAS